MSAREKRNSTIEELERTFGKACGIYITDFAGINVEKITRFRKDLREKGCRYLVVKNSLASVAFTRCGKDGLVPFIKGPVGIALTEGDAVFPAKVIKDFQKENANVMALKAAYVEGTVYSADQAIKLAGLPSREVLLSHLLSCLKAPVTNLACSLNALLIKFVGTLEALKNKKDR